jgi:hypothetical protein
MAAPVRASTCTVGTTRYSESTLRPPEELMMTRPTPPAFSTARALSARLSPSTPRLQTTILPFTLAGSSSVMPRAAAAAGSV